MRKPRGRRSTSAPIGLTGEIDLTTKLLVGLGVLVSIGLMVVSALLNYRMGYRSADTELDGLIYGAGAAMGDGLKAIAPFMIAIGYRKKDYLASVAAAVIFAVITAYSFTAALGFAAEHRSNKAAAAEGAIVLGGSVKDELERVTQRRHALGQQPSPEEVQAELENVFKQPAFEKGRTVGEISSNCTLDRKSTRSACQQVPQINGRLAQAQEAQKLDQRQQELRQELNAADGGKLRTSRDPQVEAVQRMTATVQAGVTRDDVSFYLAVLLALFVEIGSGVGLYVATTPLRNGKGTPRPGDIRRYAEQRLQPEQGRELTMTALYSDYARWCGLEGWEAVNRVTFGEGFRAVAKEIGLRHLWRDKREVYQDVQLG